MPIVTETEYRTRGAANFVGTPPFEDGGTTSRYRTVHGPVSTIQLRIGVAITKMQYSTVGA